MALRMKCTRHLCQVAPRTLLIATFSPSCASETTSLTPRRPRLVRLRRNSVQNGSASLLPMVMPSTSRRPSVLTATGVITATDTMMVAAGFDVRGVQPEIGPVALDRPMQEGLHPLVDVG